MRKYGLMALTALVTLSAYSSSEADAKSKIRGTIDKARSNAIQEASRQRERAESFRDATRSRVKDSANRARNSLNETGERAESYYHERLEGKIEEERRRFEEDPEGYSIDLGRRINNGIIQFEDIASDGIAQGFVDIECGDGRRLGDVIEVKFGIREDTTKKGVKFGVLYLMGYNPAYFVNELQIVENAEGRMVTIADIRDNPRFRQNGRNLERYIMETSDNYRRGDFSAAEQSLAAFKRELENLAGTYEMDRKREASRRISMDDGMTAKREQLIYQRNGLEKYLRSIGERLISEEIDSLPRWAIKLSSSLYQIITEVNGDTQGLLQSQFSATRNSTTINAIGYLASYTPKLIFQLRIVTNIFGESLSIEEAGDVPELRDEADRIGKILSNPYGLALYGTEEILELFENNLRELTAEYSALRYRSRGGDMEFSEWIPQIVVDNVMLEEIRLRGIRDDFSGLDYLDAVGLGIYNALLED